MRSLTGLTARQEQRFHERTIERIARRFEQRLSRELFRAYREYPQVDDHGAWLIKHRENLERIIRADYQLTWQTFGNRALDGANKHYSHRMERKFVEATPLFDAAQSAWIAQFAARKVTMILGTTEEQAERLLQQTIAASVGLSEVEVARNIRQAFQEVGGSLSTTRSRTIARTETHAAANTAEMEAARATGLPMVKEWVSSQSERTRDDHLDANGQTVGLNDPFIVGGEPLMYPGDTIGSAEQVINCRCCMAKLVQD